MGDRYELNLNCEYCTTLNEVWYAPTCNSDTFKCKECRKKNFVTSELEAKKVEDVTLDDIKEGFLMCSNASHPEERIKEICEDKLKALRSE